MENNKVMEALFGECLAYTKFGQRVHPTHVRDMLKKAFEAGKASELFEEGEEELQEGYELINCSECGKDKWVEEGTWALNKGMCEPCYWHYQGGN